MKKDERIQPFTFSNENVKAIPKKRKLSYRDFKQKNINRYKKEFFLFFQENVGRGVLFISLLFYSICILLLLYSFCFTE